MLAQSVVLTLVTVLVGTVLCAGDSVGHPGLSYFGWYTGLSIPELNATSSHTNLFLPLTVEDAVAAKAAGQANLLSTQSYFDLYTPAAPNTSARWHAAVPMLRELLQNGTIIGFNLGDELVWSGQCAS